MKKIFLLALIYASYILESNSQTFSNYNIIKLGDMYSGEYLKSNRTGTELYHLEFFSNGIERMRIGNNGNVGIGTPFPSQKLEVAGNLKVSGGSIASDGTISSNGAIQSPYGYFFRNDADPNNGAYINIGKDWNNTWQIVERKGDGNALQIYRTNNGAWSTSLLSISTNGNIGIGTPFPSQKLEVAGNLKVSGGSIASDGTISSNGAIQSPYGYFFRNDADPNNGAYINIGKDWNNTWQIVERKGDGNALQIYRTNNGAWSTSLLSISTNGNMGVSTHSPREKLDVNGKVVIGTKKTNATDYQLSVDGKVYCQEINVTPTSQWADYVFKKDYKLASLEEVEKHIAEKGHLENVPSAETVATSGYNVGDMNAILLSKIEELTLYIISQEKRIKQLETLNSK